jgi:hypothetical protein
MLCSDAIPSVPREAVVQSRIVSYREARLSAVRCYQGPKRVTCGMSTGFHAAMWSIALVAILHLASSALSAPSRTGLTIVKTVDELTNALRGGAEHVEIQAHLDLSDLAPAESIFDKVPLFAIADSKSVRVCCARAALSLHMLLLQ